MTRDEAICQRALEILGDPARLDEARTRALREINGCERSLNGYLGLDHYACMMDAREEIGREWYSRPSVRHVGDVEHKPGKMVLVAACNPCGKAITAAMYRVADRLGVPLHIRYPMRWL